MPGVADTLRLLRAWFPLAGRAKMTVVWTQTPSKYSWTCLPNQNMSHSMCAAVNSQPKQTHSIVSRSCEFPAKETTSTVCCNYEVRALPLKTISNVWCSCGLTPKEIMFHCMMWLWIPNQRNMLHCILELRRSNQRKSTLCCSWEPPAEGNPVPMHVASVSCQTKKHVPLHVRAVNSQPKRINFHCMA